MLVERILTDISWALTLFNVTIVLMFCVNKFLGIGIARDIAYAREHPTLTLVINLMVFFLYCFLIDHFKGGSP